ncbi:MAG: tRNA (adenosine(37)-N6)-dimethylallyltransferase MiaA [Deltaproteobacteria bacterium]|nr:tRNA (adenosine(37)-N6)-dimethylallyltransferase MiaA [Deltaproteobacteria bacterium]
MKPKLIIILGPTAVGKSELALELALAIDAEIVNADSQQIYRYLDIGTGKPSELDRQRVAHHLIDIVNPDDEFNAALFRRRAMQSIEQIHGRKKSVMVCGGTGLYLKALTQGLFEGPGQDPQIRQVLEAQIDSEGLAALHLQLSRVDADAAAAIHANDRQRLIRALEVFQLTGKPLSQWQKDHAFQEKPFEVLKIGLRRERAELYDRINRRSERMVEAGLLDEVRSVVARGYSLTLKPLCSVGYKQMGQVLNGEQELDAAVEEMKQETRRLAKRQLTWFGSDKEIRWFESRETIEIVAAARVFLAS